MRVIENILSVERREKDGEKYYVTSIIDSQGDESTGFSRKPDEFKVGDRVEVWFDETYHRAKFQKSRKSDGNTWLLCFDGVYCLISEVKKANVPNDSRPV